MDNNFGEIIAVIIGIGLIVLFFRYFLVIVLILGLIAAIYFIAKGIKNKKDDNVIVVEGHTHGDIDSYTTNTNKRIQDLRRYYYKIKGDDLRNMLDNVTASFKKLMKALKDDPVDFPIIRRFMTITLKSCENILRQTALLFSIENPSESNKKAIENSYDGLKLIDTAITNQINKLYDNNAIDLDVEIEVLKKSLEAKGLLDKDIEKENVENDTED